MDLGKYIDAVVSGDISLIKESFANEEYVDAKTKQQNGIKAGLQDPVTKKLIEKAKRQMAEKSKTPKPVDPDRARIEKEVAESNNLVNKINPTTGIIGDDEVAEPEKFETAVEGSNFGEEFLPERSEEELVDAPAAPSNESDVIKNVEPAEDSGFPVKYKSEDSADSNLETINSIKEQLAAKQKVPAKWEDAKEEKEYDAEIIGLGKSGNSFIVKVFNVTKKIAIPFDEVNEYLFVKEDPTDVVNPIEETGSGVEFAEESEIGTSEPNIIEPQKRTKKEITEDSLDNIGSTLERGTDIYYKRNDGRYFPGKVIKDLGDEVKIRIVVGKEKYEPTVPAENVVLKYEHNTNPEKGFYKIKLKDSFKDDARRIIIKKVPDSRQATYLLNYLFTNTFSAERYRSESGRDSFLLDVPPLYHITGGTIGIGTDNAYVVTPERDMDINELDNNRVKFASINRPTKMYVGNIFEIYATPKNTSSSTLNINNSRKFK